MDRSRACSKGNVRQGHEKSGGERMSWRIGVVLGGSVAAIGGFLLTPPFAQPLWYHDFADQRCLCGIPHALNVVSNLPFLIVGLWGLGFLLGPKAASGRAFQDPRECRAYLVFFAALALTGVGSAYYHADPTNDRLLWDRL